jgi:hypothetical protein
LVIAQQFGANPLAKLKDELTQVLATANLPFTEEQERAIVLMMEDRRQASEDLFGNLMNFQAGPTRGDMQIICEPQSNFLCPSEMR